MNSWFRFIDVTNTSLFNIFIEIRICEGDEIEDYYDDEESVDCVLAKDSAPTFEYFYNTESNCPQNTKCVNGRQCGAKGTSTDYNVNLFFQGSQNGLKF